MEEGESLVLDFRKPGKEEESLKSFFCKYLVNQERAIDRLVKKIVLANALDGQLRDKNKPAGVFLFLGPTGVGKTQLVKVFAKLLFNSFEAFTRTNCTELQQSHELSRLIGSPPGYIGSELEPGITQGGLDYWGFITRKTTKETTDQLNQLVAKQSELLAEARKAQADLDKIKDKNEPAFQEEKRKLFRVLQKLVSKFRQVGALYEQISKQNNYQPAAYPAIWLIDEIEKAHPDIFNLLMPVVDEAHLTTHGRQSNGNNVYFHNTFIFMTSNLGQEEIQKFLKGKQGIGFARGRKSTEEVQTALYHLVMKELEDKNKSRIPVEFVGRIGKENIIIFSFLKHEDFRESLDRIIIPDFITLLAKTFPISLLITESAREYLVDESCDKNNVTLGMRALENVFKRRIKENLSSLIAKTPEEGGVIAGDVVTVDLKKDGEVGELEFSRINRTSEQFQRLELERMGLVVEDKDSDSTVNKRILATFKPLDSLKT